MLRVWVHGCDPRRVSDGSRLALYIIPNSLYRVPFSGMYILLLFLSFLYVIYIFVVVFFFCSR